MTEINSEMKAEIEIITTAVTAAKSPNAAMGLIHMLAPGNRLAAQIVALVELAERIVGPAPTWQLMKGKPETPAEFVERVVGVCRAMLDASTSNASVRCYHELVALCDDLETRGVLVPLEGRKLSGTMTMTEWEVWRGDRRINSPDPEVRRRGAMRYEEFLFAMAFGTLARPPEMRAERKTKKPRRRGKNPKHAEPIAAAC